MSLILREGKDACYIITFGRLFFFGKIADEMTPTLVASNLEIRVRVSVEVREMNLPCNNT